MYLLPRIQIINEVENIALVTKDWYNSVFYSSKNVSKSKERKVTIKRQLFDLESNKSMLSLIRLSFLENCTIFRDCYLFNSFLTPSSSSSLSSSYSSSSIPSPSYLNQFSNCNENYMEEKRTIDQQKQRKSEIINRKRKKKLIWNNLRKYKKIVDIFYYLTIFGVLLLCTVSYPIFYYLEMITSLDPSLHHSYRPANTNIGIFDWNVIEWFSHVVLLICCYFILSSPLPSFNFFSFLKSKKKKKVIVRKKKKLATSLSSSSLSSPSLSSPSLRLSNNNLNFSNNNIINNNNKYQNNHLSNRFNSDIKKKKKEEEYEENDEKIMKEEKQPFRNEVWSIPFQCGIVLLISIRFLRYFENFWFPLYNLVTFFMLLTFEHTELVFVCSKIFVKYNLLNDNDNDNNKYNDNNNHHINNKTIDGSYEDKRKFLHAKVFEEIDQAKISQSITYFLTQSITSISIMFTVENNYNIILFSCITGAISLLLLMKLTKYGVRELLLLFSFVSVCIFSVSTIYSIIYFTCKYSTSLSSIFSLSFIYTAAPQRSAELFLPASPAPFPVTFCQLCQADKTSLFSFESFLIVLATFAQNFFLYLLQHCAATLWKSAPIRITRFCNIFFSDHPSLNTPSQQHFHNHSHNHYRNSDEDEEDESESDEEFSSDDSSDDDVKQTFRVNKRTYLSHNQKPYMWLTGAVIFFSILLIFSILYSILKFTYLI